MPPENLPLGAIQPVQARISLTTLHNMTGEYVDMALRGKVVITKHGQPHVTLTDSAYIERLEQIAYGNILAAMDITAVPAAKMPADLRAAILASQPTPEEFASDQWDD